MGEHQADNAAQPGVLHTDFGMVQGVWPEGAPILYRFMTTANWPDMESFRAAFCAPEMQASLRENVKIIGNAIFLITEIAAGS